MAASKWHRITNVTDTDTAGSLTQKGGHVFRECDIALTGTTDAFGTRPSDKTISLGRADVFNLVAVFDSESTSADASAPTLTIEAPEEFTFDTETGISGNTITITGHPFTNNLRIVYYNNGGSETPGLTDSTTYYVINVYVYK